jgi:DNA primase
MKKPDRIQEYYTQITDQDIGAIARELLGNGIIEEKNGLLLCDCPNHSSTTHKSLHINTAKQFFICFGCGIGGDVLHFVEFCQSGTVTKTPNGSMPETHRKARDFLAAKLNLPPLCDYGLTPEELSAKENIHFRNERALDCLSAIADYYHERLMLNPEMLSWFQEKYGISLDTITELKIGFAANGPFTDKKLQDRQGIDHELTKILGFTEDEIFSTGMFYRHPQGYPQSRFKNRIIFPYWSRGRVRYMIARSCPQTDPKDPAKYKKLEIFNELDNKHVAPVIDNRLLFNEDTLLSKPEYVILTEGVTDCISGMEHDLPCVSPVTVSIRNADWPRLIPKFHGIGRVYIAFDNETSQAGTTGALQIANRLAKYGIEARIIILPLREAQQVARNEIKTRFGITDHMDRQEVTEKKRALSDEDRRALDEFADMSKMDLNAYFLDHSREDFVELVQQAQLPRMFAAERIDPASTEVPLSEQITAILKEATNLSPVEQRTLCRKIKFRTGKNKDITTADLMREIVEHKKETKNHAKSLKRQNDVKVEAPPGTCLNVVQQTVHDMAKETDRKEAQYFAAAEAAFKWFTENSAKFFRTMEGEPILLWNNDLYWLSSKNKHYRDKYYAMMMPYCDLTPVTAPGKIFFEVFKNLAIANSEERDSFPWLYSDLENYTIYWNCNDPERRILKITPESIELIPNGANPEGVYLVTSNKLQPVEYNSAIEGEAGESEAEELISKYLIENLCCKEEDRHFIFLWAACFLLLDFSGTKPMTRFEGRSGSGKTGAAKLLSTLIFGADEQKRSTVAADKVDAERNPILFLDNIENEQMTIDRIDFFLTAITGARNEKRAHGTDSETVIERPKCLLNSSGIEPLSSDGKSELLSRTFVIPFDSEYANHNVYLEPAVLGQIKRKRNILLSFIVYRTSRVLALLRDGAQPKIMKMLKKEIKGHVQERCNDYLALMYLFYICDSSGREKKRLEALDNDFKSTVEAINQTAHEMGQNSNPIIATLLSLFDSYEFIASKSFGDTEKQEFCSKYFVNFSRDEYGQFSIENISVKQLRTALGRVAADQRLPFPYQSTQQFRQRLDNDRETIEEAGFAFTRVAQRARTRYMTITRLKHREVGFEA